MINSYIAVRYYYSFVLKNSCQLEKRKSYIYILFLPKLLQKDLYRANGTNRHCYRSKFKNKFIIEQHS